MDSLMYGHWKHFVFPIEFPKNIFLHIYYLITWEKKVDLHTPHAHASGERERERELPLLTSLDLTKLLHSKPKSFISIFVQKEEQKLN